MDVHIALVDAYGNVADAGVLPYEVDPLGGLGLPVEGPGVRAASFPVLLTFEEAGLGENLWVHVGEYSTEISDVDVALACDDIARPIDAVGVADGRVYRRRRNGLRGVGADDLVYLELDAER